MTHLADPGRREQAPVFRAMRIMACRAGDQFFSVPRVGNSIDRMHLGTRKSCNDVSARLFSPVTVCTHLKDGCVEKVGVITRMFIVATATTRDYLMNVFLAEFLFRMACIADFRMSIHEEHLEFRTVRVVAPCAISQGKRCMSFLSGEFCLLMAGETQIRHVSFKADAFPLARMVLSLNSDVTRLASYGERSVLVFGRFSHLGMTRETGMPIFTDSCSERRTEAYDTYKAQD